VSPAYVEWIKPVLNKLRSFPQSIKFAVAMPLAFLSRWWITALSAKRVEEIWTVLSEKFLQERGSTAR
jgi:hypothetical protein